MTVVRSFFAGDVRFFTRPSLADFSHEPDHGGAPSAPLGRGVRERLDERRPLERLPDDRALDSDAPAVNQADLAKALRGRRFDVLGDDGGRLPGAKGVEVERVPDLYPDGIGRVILHGLRITSPIRRGETMNRSLPAVVLLALFTASPLLAQGAKPRVAVLEFVDKSTHTYSWYQVGRAAQDMMVTALVKGDAFRVIDRERLQALMQEKNLSISGDVDPKTAVKVGKLLGVEYIIVGSITEFGVT